MISITHPQTTFAALFLTLTSYFTSLTLFLTLTYHLQEPLVIKQTISLSFYHIFFFANAVLHSWRFPLHPPPSLSSLIFLKFIYQKNTDSTTPLSGDSDLSGQSRALRTSSLRSSTGDSNTIEQAPKKCLRNDTPTPLPELPCLQLGMQKALLNFPWCLQNRRTPWYQVLTLCHEIHLVLRDSPNVWASRSKQKDKLLFSGHEPRHKHLNQVLPICKWTPSSASAADPEAVTGARTPSRQNDFLWCIGSFCLSRIHTSSQSPQNTALPKPRG